MECPLLDWAGSGLMLLTGRPNGPPLAPAAPVLSRLRAELAGAAYVPDIELRQVLSGRARQAGFSRQGAQSANGSCELIQSSDGWVALNLARESDWPLLSALVGVELDVSGTELQSRAGLLAAAAAEMAGIGAAALQAQAELLALPLAALPALPAAAAPSAAAEPADPANPADPAAVSAITRPAALRASRGVPDPQRWPALGLGLEGVTVLNLASLWAGPLTAQLLSLAGAEVLSVQSTTRPDPSRDSQPEFYRWLHRGQREQHLDFGALADRRRLAELIIAADVVIEGSRPRALRQLGLGPEDLTPRPGQVWLSITGYGRDSNRVAFGDDAAVAGGLVARDQLGPVFCGDALADPLSGVFGYRAVLDALSTGGGELIDLAMSAVAAELARPDSGAGAACGAHDVRLSARTGGWQARCGERVVDIAEPFALPS
jgi:hypothetical protein